MLTSVVDRSEADSQEALLGEVRGVRVIRFSNRERRGRDWLEKTSGPTLTLVMARWEQRKHREPARERDEVGWGAAGAGSIQICSFDSTAVVNIGRILIRGAVERSKSFLGCWSWRYSQLHLATRHLSKPTPTSSDHQVSHRQRQPTLERPNTFTQVVPHSQAEDRSVTGRDGGFQNRQRRVSRPTERVSRASKQTTGLTSSSCGLVRTVKGHHDDA